MERGEIESKDEKQGERLEGQKKERKPGIGEQIGSIQGKDRGKMME